MSENYQFRGTLEFDADAVHKAIGLLEGLGEEIGAVPVDPGYPGEWSPGNPSTVDADTYRLTLNEGAEVTAGDGTEPIDTLLSRLGGIARKGTVFETYFIDEPGELAVGPSRDAIAQAIHEFHDQRRLAALRQIGVEGYPAPYPEGVVATVDEEDSDDVLVNELPDSIGVVINTEAVEAVYPTSSLEIDDDDLECEVAHTLCLYRGPDREATWAVFAGRGETPYGPGELDCEAVYLPSGEQLTEADLDAVADEWHAGGDAPDPDKHLGALARELVVLDAYQEANAGFPLKVGIVRTGDRTPEGFRAVLACADDRAVNATLFGVAPLDRYSLDPTLEPVSGDRAVETFRRLEPAFGKQVTLLSDNPRASFDEQDYERIRHMWAEMRGAPAGP